MLANGAPLEAVQIAERRFTSRVAEVFRKSAVSPASLSTASSLAEYTGTTVAFLESNGRRTRPHVAGWLCRRIPRSLHDSRRQRFCARRSCGQADLERGAGRSHAGRDGSDDNNRAERGTAPQSGALIRRELAGAVGATTDAEFIRLITAGLTPLTSAGATSNQIMQDISRLLDAGMKRRAGRAGTARPATTPKRYD
jgi:hypothetical protein